MCLGLVNIDLNLYHNILQHFCSNDINYEIQQCVFGHKSHQQKLLRSMFPAFVMQVFWHSLQLAFFPQISFLHTFPSSLLYIVSTMIWQILIIRRNYHNKVWLWKRCHSNGLPAAGLKFLGFHKKVKFSGTCIKTRGMKTKWPESWWQSSHGVSQINIRDLKNYNKIIF